MRILVLGGGLQGSTVADDLRQRLPSARVDVADVRPGVGTIQADLSDTAVVSRLLSECDLGVCALPSKFGFNVLRAAIHTKRNLVDLSFTPEDALSLDTEARRAGITIVPDCGVAPGLTNLLVGHALAEGPVDEARIFVGGIPQDQTRPYGYVVTWSVEDLLELYTRPAKIVRNGRVQEVPAMSGLETIEVPGVGTLESFRTDGLRSLLTLPIPNMEERTLRWKGHIESIQPLLKAGTLVEEFRKKCISPSTPDLVVFRVEIRREERTTTTQCVDRHDGRRTAMTRMTALTCSAVTHLLADREVPRTGVVSMEELGRNAAATERILHDLENRGVRFSKV